MIYLRFLPLLLVLLLARPMAATAQDQPKKITIYHPEADAAVDLAAAVKKAKAENKHVLVQVGGNWCSWCIMFHNLTTTDAKIDSVLKANYVVQKVNYSKENRNLAVLATLSYPQRFGFPVFVVLDQNGQRLHTQNSAYLEEGKGYSQKKILEFLNHWAPAALDPKQYQKQ